MSWTLSTNAGSVESLKVRSRCGLSPNARQMRCTLAGEIPTALLMLRELQWLASSGLVWVT
ncbi:hypothetical protein D3C80_2180420 [compost metagenome]